MTIEEIIDRLGFVANAIDGDKGKPLLCGVFDAEALRAAIGKLRTHPEAQPNEPPAGFARQFVGQWVTATDKALSLVKAERQRQDQLWGDQRECDLNQWPRILGEEFGELCEALNETIDQKIRHPEKGGYENVLREATHVAAVAVEIIEAMQARISKEEAVGDG